MSKSKEPAGVPLASFSFAKFHELMPTGMVGASQAALFLRLPTAMQAAAWADLGRAAAASLPLPRGER